jgi:hypothetical protein
MKVLPLLLIIMMISVVVLSGCEEKNPPLTKEEKRFLGTWKGPTIHVMAFFPYRACSFHSDFSGYWEVKDGKLIIELKYGTVILDYIFSEDDSIVTITEEASGYTGDYIRQ